MLPIELPATALIVASFRNWIAPKLPVVAPSVESMMMEPTDENSRALFRDFDITIFYRACLEVCVENRLRVLLFACLSSRANSLFNIRSACCEAIIAFSF